MRESGVQSFFFRKRKKNSQSNFSLSLFFELSILLRQCSSDANASPGAHRRRLVRIKRRQQVRPLPADCDSENSPQAGRGFPLQKKKKEKKEKLLATQSTHAAHFPFLLARSLSKPKSRSSRACRPDDPKQETLRDGLNNVSDLEKERGENWKKAKGFRFGCQRLDHFFFL